MNRQQLLDLYFMDARSKLIDIAAFLDRLDRADGEGGFQATWRPFAWRSRNWIGRSQRERKKC